MRRLRYRHEVTEIEFYDGFAPQAELGSVHVLELLGHVVLSVVRVLAVTLGMAVRIGRPVLRETVCIALAAVGMVGRALDHAGCAAARHSRVLCAVGEALEQLPPRRVENRNAITVRVVR